MVARKQLGRCKGKEISNMQVIELLKLSRNLLKTCRDVGVQIDDVRFISLYDDYISLKSSSGGLKTTYIVAKLALKYAISERKVYYLIKRLGAECKPGAV